MARCGSYQNDDVKKMIPYARQNITKNDIKSVVKVLKSDFLTQGPIIGRFEKAFASYVGSKYSVAVSNGTAALHLSALALGVHSGTRVITTPISFVASSNCVLYCGGEIKFIDINPDNYLLDIKKLEDFLKNKPKGYIKGLIVVDFAGYPANMESFHKLALKYNFWIIEDACHAPGGYFIDSRGVRQKCGNGKFSDLSVFSFHPVKHITAGEGGMITTNRRDLYKKILSLRNHGITKDAEKMVQSHGGWYYEMQELGFNYRLTDIQAALGVSQLKQAKNNLKKRKDIVRRYNEAFKKIKNADLLCPNIDSGFGHAYHLYIIQTDKRKELYEYLKIKGINCQVHYIPIHLQPYYKKFGYKKGDFPVAEKYYEKCLSLPLFPSLKKKEQDYVIKSVEDFYEKQR